MLCRLGSALWAAVCEALAPLRTLGSRLRMLLVLEKRPPMSNSASKEKARKCRDHFLPAFFAFFSDTAAPSPRVRFFLLLAKNKNKKRPTRAATTSGTATAALSAEEHEMLSHLLWETVTAPLVLLAAFVAVVEAWVSDIEDAAEVTDVVKVVDDIADVGAADGDSDAEAGANALALSDTLVKVAALLDGAPVRVPVVWENSLASDDAMLSRSVVSGPSGVVMPVKPAPSGCMVEKEGAKPGENGGVNAGVFTALRAIWGLERK